MISRVYGKVVFVCDGDKCHESLDTETDDFNSANSIRAKNGWKTVKDGQEWINLCPDCKHDY